MQKPSVDVQKLDIMGDQVTTWRDNRNGKIYVECRGRCEFLGVDWSGQRKRLIDSKFFGRHLGRGVISTPGGEQEVIGLELKYLRMWLASINPDRVKPEIQETLIAYQEKCAQVLDRHWNTRTPRLGDNFERPIQIESSKDYNAHLADRGGGKLYPKENARICRDLSDWHMNPSDYQKWAEDQGWTSQKRASGQEVLRHKEPPSAAACSFMKRYVVQGHAYDKVLPVAEHAKTTFNMMYLAGLDIAELQE